MGNVKVRKQRHLRQGIEANPYPTAEQVLAQVAAGVVTTLAQNVVDKAVAKFEAFGRNRNAGADIARRVARSAESQSARDSVVAERAAKPAKPKKPSKK